METIVKKAKEYAIHQHQLTNHKYGNHCYSKHLEDVFYVGLKFIPIMPPKEHENILAALWLHDVIEDCRITYNDLRNDFNVTIADLVYAVTNEKGKNRKERANDRYYQGIKDTPGATFVKLCDRIANVQHSKESKSTMLKKYEDELHEFEQSLGLKGEQKCAQYHNIYNPMQDYLYKSFK